MKKFANAIVSRMPNRKPISFPTVYLVGSKVFVNIRVRIFVYMNDIAKVIPVKSSESANEKVIESLKKWVGLNTYSIKNTTRETVILIIIDFR